MPQHEDTAVDTKVWQYHRPIARHILFWLKGDSFMPAGFGSTRVYNLGSQF